jgi:glycosyltransferase involved in cell wall biosynthesis
LANSSGTTHIVGPLAEAQARLGHEISVYFVSKPGEEAVIPNAKLVDVTEFPMSISSRHYGWSRSFAKAVKRNVSRFDAVHIHAIWNFPTWWSMRCADRVGVPYIVAPQGSLEEWALGRSRFLKQLYARIFEKPLFDNASRMQALTECEAIQCGRFGVRTPTEILPNGIDLAAIEACRNRVDLRSEYGLPNDEQILLFVSRIFPKKGLDLLAPAFARVVREQPDVTLVIAGHDAGSGYLEDVKQMFAAAGALEKTRFLGEVKGSHKFEVLRGADLFVLPSHSEGLPVAVLEAMAVGLPVIVTPACNLPEVEIHKAGWVADTNVDSLSKKLQQALASAQERKQRGSNGAALVRKHFTWDTIARDSMEIYRRMISGRAMASGSAVNAVNIPTSSPSLSIHAQR